jgi:hypothetical protein
MKIVLFKMNKNLVTFRGISTFVQELTNMFGTKHRPLLLYKRLLEKTGITLEKAMQKHIDSFKSFCVSNKEAILEMKTDKITTNKISYNENVFIDMKHIFGISDSSSSKIIWKHLLYIYCLVDPESGAKEILKELKENKDSDDVSENKSGVCREEEILANIIKKVETSLDKESIDKDKPMETVTKIMSTGVFNELISDMQTGLKDGSLDMGRLLMSVQGMVGKISSENGGNSGGMPDISSMMGMMSMMNTGSGSDSGSVPDLSGMMNMLNNKQ